MIELNRDHGFANVMHLRGFKPVVPAPNTGVLDGDQWCALVKRPDQSCFDPIGMKRSVGRQHRAGHAGQRQSARPIVGPIHRIEDETVSRRAGTDFPALAFFRINDERQLEFLKDSQSRVVGGQVEAFDAIALRILRPSSRTVSFRDRAPHLAVEQEQSLRPGLLRHDPSCVSSVRAIVGNLTVGFIHRWLFERLSYWLRRRHHSPG